MSENQDLELNVKLQVSVSSTAGNKEVSQAFYNALITFANDIKENGIKKSTQLRGPNLAGIMEIQSTMSYINSMERDLQKSIDAVQAKLDDPSVPKENKAYLKTLQQSYMQSIEGLYDAQKEDNSLIRMTDLGPHGFDTTWP